MGSWLSWKWSCVASCKNRYEWETRVRPCVKKMMNVRYMPVPTMKSGRSIVSIYPVRRERYVWNRHVCIPWYVYATIRSCNEFNDHNIFFLSWFFYLTKDTYMSPMFLISVLYKILVPIFAIILRNGRTDCNKFFSVC